MITIQMDESGVLDGEEFDAFLEIGDTKSVMSEFSEESLGSFHCPTPSNRHRFPVEILINFLSSSNIEEIDTVKLESMTNTVLSKSKDPELLKVVKLYGWSGSKYVATENNPFEPDFLLQALSNLYLKQKNSITSMSYANLFGLGDTSGLDQMLAFCPDCLLDYLNTHALPNQLAEAPTDNQAEGSQHTKELTATVPSLSFFGACMLVDISGFSKFSGAMCSKGVGGLDELRKATNGFLGHFVETVYEFNGDGECYC